MRSNVRKMFDGLYMKTETTYRAVQTRKDAKHIVKNMGRVSDELMETYKKEVEFSPDEYGEYITRLLNLVQSQFPSADAFIDDFLKVKE